MRKTIDAFARVGASCPPAAFGLLALAIVSAAGVPASLAAQAATSGERNLTVGYQPGSAQQNGYADAQLRMTYRFQDCAEGVGLVISAESRPHMLVAPHRYWVDGQLVQVPPEISPNELSNGPTIRGTVNGRGMSKQIAHQWTNVRGTANCWNDGTMVADHLEVWERGATPEQKAAALRELAFHPSEQLPPLRNSRVEDHFRSLWRQARADSIARVREAERAERERAEREERERREREEAERRAEEERQREAAEAAQAEGAAPGESASSSASGGSGAPMSPEEARRAEEQRRIEEARRAEEERRAEEAREAEHLRRVLEEQRRQQEEQQRRDEEREEAYVNAATSGVQTAMELGIGFGGYYFAISDGTYSSTFDNLQGFGMGFDAEFLYLDVGVLTGAYTEGFQEEYESDGYSSLDDPTVEGYFGNAGVMWMMMKDPGMQLGFSGGMLYAVTPETDMYSPVMGFVGRFGGFALRLDMGLGDQSYLGGAVYFNLGG